MKGFVNINKPMNMTSSDVVIKVRGILRRFCGEKQKVGHFGTLDPIGTGVLPIAIGNATRLFDYSLNKTKIYQTSFKFGLTTDTLDTTGKIIEQTPKIPSKDEILAKLELLIGPQNQIPPMYSAKSINGRRAYDIARSGKIVDLEPKLIEIYSIKLIDEDAINNEYYFEIMCSGGTYIRSIARDLGNLCDSLAVMSSIKRIKSGDFTIDNSVTIDDFANDPSKYILPINIALDEYEKFVLPEDKAFHALNGIVYQFDNLPIGEFAVEYNNDIVGIAENVQGKLVFKTRL